LTVLDGRPPRLARRGAAARRARQLADAGGRSDAAAELHRRGLVRAADLRAMGVHPEAEPVAGDWLADPGHWAELGRRLREFVEQHGKDHPMDPGVPPEAARRALGLPDRALVEALVSEPLTRRDGRIYGRSTRPSLPPRIRKAVDAVRRDLHHTPFRAPDAGRLSDLGLTANVLAAAVAAGSLLKVTDGIVLLPGAPEHAASLLARLEQPFTLSQARQALDTTRRVAVPLLEYLDAHGLTRRLDNTLRTVSPPANGG
jgi:selenocysteine-specific elongation factor